MVSRKMFKYHKNKHHIILRFPTANGSLLVGYVSSCWVQGKVGFL